jgi:aldehyde:ferredoxin oxidoreductase
MKSGERINIFDGYMKTRERISVKNDVSLRRLLKEGRKNDPKSKEVPLEKILKSYYRIRSYDASGKPTAKIMKSFSIEIR